MSGGGFGPGNVGAGITPQQREWEATAWTEINKTLSGIIRDDIRQTVPFTQINPEQTWKYDTRENNPVLHPLRQMRVDKGSTMPPQEAWKERFEQLMDLLPGDIKSRLTDELQKPLANRLIEFTILNNAMILLAKALAWIESGGVDSVDRTERERQINSALPLIGLAGGVQLGERVVENIEEYILSIGPNDPDYDFFSNVIEEARKGLEELRDLAEAVSEGADVATLQPQFKAVAIQFGRLRELVELQTHGEQNKILNANFFAIETILGALGGQEITPILSIAVTVVMMGLSSESGLGSVGPGLSLLFDGIFEGTIGAFPAGSGNELQEMNDLYESLATLRNGTGDSI